MRTLAVCLALSCASAVSAAPPPRDPDLPKGARLRLGTPRWRLDFAQRPSAPLVLSPDRKTLALCGRDRAVEVFDLRTGRRRFRLWDREPECDFLHPLAFSHDGKTLAVDHRRASSFLVLWSLAEGGRPGLVLPYPGFASNGRPLCAAFLPGDERLATYDGESLVVWDVAKGERLREDRVRSYRHADHFSPDGRLFAAQVGASLVLHDLVGGGWRRIALALPDDEDPAARWSWSADGRLLALTTSLTEPRIYDARTGRLVRRLRSAAEAWKGVGPMLLTAFSPDGKTLAVEAGNGVLLCDLGSGELSRRIHVELHRPEYLMNLAFRDDGRLLVLDWSPFVRTFDVRTGKEIHPGVGHRATVTDLAFDADGKTLVSVSEDGRLIRWDARTGRVLREMDVGAGTLERQPRCERTLSLSDDGRSASLVGREAGYVSDVQVSLLDVHEGRALWHERSWPIAQQFGALGGGINLGGGFGFGPRSGLFCVVSRGGSLVSMPRMGQIGGYVAEVRRANGGRAWSLGADFDVRQAFSPDSRELALADGHRGGAVVRLVDLQTGEVRLTWEVSKPAHRLLALAYSPDGRLLAGADRRYAYLWESASGEQIERVTLPRGMRAMQVVVTRAGRVVVAGTYPKGEAGARAGIAWDVETREALVTTAAFSEDHPVAICGRGRTLAVPCADSSILVYDVPAPDPPRRAPLDDARRRRLWDDLASADAKRAWRARLRLADDPGGVSLLDGRLKPAPARTISGLADLDHDDFDARQAASKKLAEALRRGDRGAEVALRDLLDRPPSSEARHRAHRLLADAKTIPFTSEELRAIRAVGVLEQIADEDAKALLKRLSGGGPSLLTAEARAALARLPQK
jgi:WD40 repeat protein